MFANKNCPKNDKLYIFEKPLIMPFQICKKFCKILKNGLFANNLQKFILIFNKHLTIAMNSDFLILISLPPDAVDRPLPGVRKIAS